MNNLEHMFNFAENVKNLPKALEIMALGMGGIFIALFVLYLLSMALIKIFPEESGK